MTEEIGFEEAMQELESILADLQSDDVDVDTLAARVDRAARLIEVCRERISATRLQVEEIVSTVQTDEDE